MTTTPQQPDWRQLVAEVRDEIARLRTPSGAVPAAASRALQRLAELDAAVERRLEAEADARRRRVVGPRGPESVVIYRLEISPRGDFLAELREDGPARPMKVRVELCRQVAATVAALAEPTRFGPIHKSVEQALGERVAPYTVRVPLRFWAATGLITHQQARFFRTLPPQRFLAAVRSGLRGLVKSELRFDPES
ncbi:MAG: hypothetical protein AAFR76_05770 [Planctomycetota bacterium]